MPLFQGQHIGVIVGTEGEGPAMPVLLQAFREDGAAMTSGARATIPPGKSLTYDFAPLPQHFTGLGKVTVRCTPDAAPDAAAETVIETYPGAWAMFGGDTLNPLPLDADIASLEVQTGHTLCEDHKRFLQTRNGINWSWWQDPAWDTTRREGEHDFYSAMRAQEQAQKTELGLLADATHLFGAGQGHPYLSYPDRLGDFGFYDTAFLRFGIPVGVDAGGNLYVQILDGRRRGEVVFLDHEYHFGLLDEGVQPAQLAREVRAIGSDKPLADFTADEFWQLMDKVGYSLPAAPDLGTMIAKLTAHHTALITALAPDWRRA
ncbi:hypothetical protein ABMC88_05295 [Sulfitobacter sp. HNIBRBA2951]|uniref:hypothetical protein n=1 Tax=Sulfitobacter aquimarinus TaxID=3158557 RepID=UPI0032E01DE2